MKKNKIMRIASALLVLALLSTCAISGTFAKYVTSDSASDTARVAKFGVVVTAWDDSAFSTSYETGNETVVSSTSDKLVAPGTKNDTGITFSITGTPEVDVEVDFVLTVNKDVFLNVGTYADETTGTTDDKYTVDTVYTPVVFTLTNDGNAVATGTLSDIKAYLEADTFSKVYDANTNLTETFGTYTLTWAWDFPATEDAATDKKDTTLGNLAAGVTVPTTATELTTLNAKGAAAPEAQGDYCLNIDFEIEIVVTQVD